MRLLQRQLHHPDWPRESRQPRESWPRRGRLDLSARHAKASLRLWLLLLLSPFLMLLPYMPLLLIPSKLLLLALLVAERLLPHSLFVPEQVVLVPPPQLLLLQRGGHRRWWRRRRGARALRLCALAQIRHVIETQLVHLVRLLRALDVLLDMPRGVAHEAFGPILDHLRSRGGATVRCRRWRAAARAPTPTACSSVQAAARTCRSAACGPLAAAASRRRAPRARDARHAQAPRASALSSGACLALDSLHLPRRPPRRAPAPSVVARARARGSCERGEGTAAREWSC